MNSDAVRDLLLFVVLPVWILAGFGDYLCHRLLEIEKANGVRESALHWLMLGEIGAAMLAATFLHIDAAVLIFICACLIAHEVTTHFDLKLANATRLVPPLEQQIHSLLEVLPFAALLLIAVLHWDQVLALIGHGAADFSIRLAPFPGWTALGIGGSALTVFSLLPYAEEILRGYREERRQSRHNRDIP